MAAKAAICLSGVDRFFYKVFPYFVKNLVEPLKANVFIHTWSGVHDRFPPNPKHLSSWIADSGIKAKVEVEEYNSDWNFKRVPFVRNISPMFYSIYRSFSLIEDHYDIVIRSRLDTLYDSIIDPVVIPDTALVRFNGVNRGQFAPRQEFVFEGTGEAFVADNFCISDWATAKVYSETYLNLGDFLSQTNIPESCLARQLIGNNKGYQWSDCKFKSLIDVSGDRCLYESYYDSTESVVL